MPTSTPMSKGALALPARGVVAVRSTSTTLALRTPADDPNQVSLAESLPLHLMSEHGISDALRMSALDAEELHLDLHTRGYDLAQDHSVQDRFFRPALALAVLQQRVARHEQIQRLLVPEQTDRR